MRHRQIGGNGQAGQRQYRCGPEVNTESQRLDVGFFLYPFEHSFDDSPPANEITHDTGLWN